MKVKLIAVMILSAVAVGLAFSEKAQPVAAKAGGVELLAQLPASDGAALVDSRRMLTESVPRILSANQPVLSRIMGVLTTVETKTGVDLKKFDNVAVGFNLKQIEGGKMSMAPVVLARGDVKAGSLLAMMKLGADGTYRKEKFGGKTLYVFSAEEIAKKHAAKMNAPAASAALEVFGFVIEGDLAVTVLDPNTIALGSVDRVRSTISHDSSLSAEIMSDLTARSSSAASFSMVVPVGAESFIPYDSDELGNQVKKIRALAGSLDTSPNGATLSFAAKAVTADDAAQLYDLLDALKGLGKSTFTASKDPKKQMYGRLIGSAKLSVSGDKISLNVAVPQSDIDSMIAAKK